MTNDEFKSAIGKRIAALRESKKWTLADLQRESGLGVTAISNYERGQRLAGPEEIILLARALGVSPVYLSCLADFDSSGAQTVAPLRLVAPPAVRQKQEYANAVARLVTLFGQATEDGQVDILDSAEGAPKVSDQSVASPANDHSQ